MTVKLRRKVREFGQEFETTIYIPEDELLTRLRKEEADQLDKVLKEEIEKINSSLDSLEGKIRETDIEKWRWLGQRIDLLLRKLRETGLLDQRDVDTNAIWPAIGQYLRRDLKRGYEDSKRSGTKKDHYRKCWALATLPGTRWITSWVGWDAFTDRGEQLVYSKRLMPLMEKRFFTINPPLNSRDFQLIAKITTKCLPSQANSFTDIDAMSIADLQKIVNLVYKEFIDRRKVMSREKKEGKKKT